MKHLLAALLSIGKEKRDYSLAKELWNAEFKHESFDYVYSMIQNGEFERSMRG